MILLLSNRKLFKERRLKITMTYKDAGKLFFQSLLLLILLFGLVRLVTVKSGTLMVLELLLLGLLLVLSAVGLATYKHPRSRVLFLVFLLYTGNLLLLWYFYQSLYLVLLLVSVVALLVSMPCCRKKSAGESKKEGESTPPKPATSAPPQKVGEAKEVERREAAKVTAKFTPGKYVASRRSNVYHEPKCDWAKKIQKDRRLWFASREEALNKGYKKHDCVR